VVAAKSNGGKNIFFVAREYDSDGHLAVIGAVGGVERTAAGVEADFSAKVTAKGGFKR
jgi:homoserine dehydrogenase